MTSGQIGLPISCASEAQMSLKPYPSHHCCRHHTRESVCRRKRLRSNGLLGRQGFWPAKAEVMDCRSRWPLLGGMALAILCSSTACNWPGNLVCSSDRCGRFCGRSRAFRWAKTSMFMRVGALELLVQNHVGRFWSSRRCCK